MKEIQVLVGELVTLPHPVLKKLPCDDELREEFIQTSQLAGGAKQRQVKYLVKLLQNSEIELATLYQFLSGHKGRKLEEKKQLHLVEFYRDALINEALEKKQDHDEFGDEWGEQWRSQTLEELQELWPDIDILTLSRLGYLFAQTRNPRHSREIFRYLRSIQEQMLRNRTP